MPSDFTPLPIAGGVSEYHLNRFRVAFDASKLPAAKLSLDADAFYKGFGKYLKSDAAKVDTATGKTHDGKAAFEFTGTAKLWNIDFKAFDYVIPDFAHTDWVYVLDKSNNSFTAQTLKRNFRGPIEQAAWVAADKAVWLAEKASELTRGTAKANELAARAAKKALEEVIHINSHHFLAGRRAWRLHDGPKLGYGANVRVLETVAIERFSHTFYRFSWLAIGEIETLVRNVWLNLLKNYIRDNGYRTVGTPPPGSGGGWKADGNYHYVQMSYADAAALGKSPHMPEMKTLYPHVAAI